MRNDETNLQNLIRLALSDAGVTNWRNETGGYWTGQVVSRGNGTVTLKNARMVKCGLCKGSADIIGIGEGGRFVAAEVKTATGRVSAEQRAFLEHVNRRGGIAGVVRSVDDALALIKGGV